MLYSLKDILLRPFCLYMERAYSVLAGFALLDTLHIHTTATKLKKKRKGYDTLSKRERTNDIIECAKVILVQLAAIYSHYNFSFWPRTIMDTLFIWMAIYNCLYLKILLYGLYTYRQNGKGIRIAQVPAGEKNKKYYYDNIVFNEVLLQVYYLASFLLIFIYFR